MKFYTARQAIHDAYALHLRSKGFEVNQVSAVSKPDWSAQMARIQRMKEQPRVAALAEFAPVGHYRGDQSVKLDTDRLIWDSVQAGRVIAAVEALPMPMRDWVVWCYGPWGHAFEMNAQASLFGWISEQLDAAITGCQRRYRQVVVGKIRNVVAYTIIDYRHWMATDQHLYSNKAIKKNCRIQHGNWSRDFKQWQLWAHRLSDELDAKALPSVGKVLGGIDK